MGGTSYTTLALAQIPVLFFDYALFITNPTDIFKAAYSLSPTKMLELMLFSNSIRYFGFNTRLLDNTILLSNLLINNYSFRGFSDNLPESNNFRLFEQLHYYSSGQYSKASHELENIEYYYSSTLPYENFINI